MEQIIVTHPDGRQLPLFSTEAVSGVTKAEQTTTLLAEDIVSISVQSATPLDFILGDTVEVYGRTYTLNQLPTVKKQGDRRFSYDLTFEGTQYELLDVQFMLPDGTVGDSLTGNLLTFLQVLVGNANRLFTGRWTVGEYPAETEYKTLTFSSGENCLSVLQRLCEEYKQEFEIAQPNARARVLHIRTAGVDFPYTFRYGRTGGLYELTRQNVSSSSVVTRLFAYGGSSNVPSKYFIMRNSQRICLPFKNKSASYVQRAEAVAAFGVKENTKTFDDIFPNRYGNVTALGGQYYAFVDNTMSFDLNERDGEGNTKYLIAGVNAKVHFNTGRLAGYEFDVHSYNHATKTIEIVPFEDENGMHFPSIDSAAFRVGVGDQYFFVDINLPDAYITEAEQKLQAEAEAYYEQNCQPKVQYALSIDENFLKQFDGELTVANLFSVGDYIPVEDADIGVSKHLRITSFTRDLLKPYRYSVTLGDAVTKALITRIIASQRTVDNIVKINNLADPAKARRNWMASQEVLSMVFDPDGHYYSEKIKPLSIETSMLQVGARSAQFVLQNVTFEPNYQGNPNYIRISGGSLTHYTIEDNIRTWTIAATEVSELRSNTAYYIYARCSKMALETAGSIILDANQRPIDYETSHYTFLVGVLNSVVYDTDESNPARMISLTYGSSTVNGRFIKTGRIESAAGDTYFDLDNSEIGGRIVFLKNGEKKTIDELGYDNTKTAIEGGLVTSGTVQLAGDDSNIKAGITGEGTSDNSVRIWAGASKANKETAPFRVQQNGKLIASNAEITGKVTATDGSFTGNVNATSGKIGGFDIGSGVIGVDNDGLDGLALHNSFIKFSQSGIWAGFGTNVLPASSGVVALGRFENNTPNPYSDNYGVIIKVSGGNNNHALSLRGDIQGFAVAAKQISSNYTATADDCILSCKNSAAMTLTLPTPSASQIGKVYIIKQFNVQAVVISCTNGIYAEHQVSEFSLYNNTKRGGACILVNDGQYWMVVADYWG